MRLRLGLRRAPLSGCRGSAGRRGRRRGGGGESPAVEGCAGHEMGRTVGSSRALGREHVHRCISWYDFVAGFDAQVHDQTQWLGTSELGYLASCARKLGLKAAVDIVEIVADSRSEVDSDEFVSVAEPCCRPPRDPDLIRI